MSNPNLPASGGISRRSVAKAAAWSVPVLALAIAAPGASASVPVAGKLFSAASCTVLTPAVNPRNRIFLRWIASGGTVPAGTLIWAEVRPGLLYDPTDARIALQNLAYVGPPVVISIGRVRYNFVTTVDLAPGDFAQVRITDKIAPLPVIDWRFTAVTPAAISVSGSRDDADTFIGDGSHASVCPATG